MAHCLTIRLSKLPKWCYNTHINSKEHTVDFNTFFVFMALVGGPALCIAVILIKGKEQK